MIGLKEERSEMNLVKIEKKIIKAVVMFSIALIMIYLNIKEFPIFLSIIEVSNVVLAVSISMIVLNTYVLSEHKEFPMMGIAYLFISIFLLLHTIIMTSEHQLNSTSSIMLIIALYMESGSFLAKGILLKKKINIYACIMIYSVISILLLFEVFKWDFIYHSIISETGIYYFTKGSLHIIGTLFAISAAVFYKKRKALDKNISQSIITALLLKILSAFILSFTLVDESNNFIDLIGYFAAILSFYFLYQGVIIANLRKPYTKINMQNDTLRAILESTADGILVTDDLKKVLHYNKKCQKMWNIPDGTLIYGDNKELLSFIKDQLLYPDDIFSKLAEIVDSSSDDITTIFFKDGGVYQCFSKPLLIDHKICGRV